MAVCVPGVLPPLLASSEYKQNSAPSLPALRGNRGLGGPWKTIASPIRPPADAPAPAGPTLVGARSPTRPRGVGCRSPPRPRPRVRRRLLPPCPGRALPLPARRAASTPRPVGSASQPSAHAQREEQSGCSRTRTRGSRDRLREAAEVGERPATRPRGSASPRPRQPPPGTRPPAQRSRRESLEGIPRKGWHGCGSWNTTGPFPGRSPGLDVKVFSLLLKTFLGRLSLGVRTCAAPPSGPLSRQGPRPAPSGGTRAETAAQKGRPRAQYIRGGRRLRQGPARRRGL